MAALSPFRRRNGIPWLVVPACFKRESRDFDLNTTVEDKALDSRQERAGMTSRDRAPLYLYDFLAAKKPNQINSTAPIEIAESATLNAGKCASVQ
jgi:hypothetical protein